jgi:LysR family hydrogen peroxide-inducible transcriptional activator
MVAANVGVTLLPSLAVKPPVAQSDAIRLLPFRDPQPSRRIAMVWRRSSAMSDFLMRLAGEFKRLPRELLAADAPVPKKPRASKAKRT